MSYSTYKIKKDFNDKVAEHFINTTIPGNVANLVKRNENRNNSSIEPIKYESIISHRMIQPKITKESMKNRKLSYFSSIVE